MSGREWKPGDVVLVPFSGRRVRAMWVADKGWALADGRGEARAFVDVRPLVVIDPEDSAQVERLAKDFHESDHIAPWHDLHSETRAQITDALQDALRSFLKPPKPEEPIGLGAVVEDADGLKWLRAFGEAGYHVWHSERVDTAPQQWHSIAAVKVLSPGVSDA